MKILYVEDSAEDADLLRRKLLKVAPHFRLETVATLEQAMRRLERLDAEPLDLVLTDVHLPDGDGLNLLLSVREHALALAVVVITGAGDEETAVAALKAGADDYVVKRKDYLERLPLTLESALYHYRAGASLRSSPLRVLYAEHDPQDVDLTRRHFSKYASHIHIDAVSTGPAVLKQLQSINKQDEYDVLLLDYRLPGKDALELLKELRLVHRLDIPIVIVTGQGSEEVALQAIKLGASSYVVKNPGYLYQLPGELEHVVFRVELSRREKALRDSEERNRAILNAIPDLMFLQDKEGVYLDYHAQDRNHLLVAPEDFLGKKMSDVLPHELAQELYRCFERALETSETQVHEYMLPLQGERMWFEARIARCNGEKLLSVVRDITERKRDEEQIKLLQTITMEMAAANDLSSALEVMLRCVCEKTGWAFGQAWLPRPDKTVLECSEAYFSGDAELEKFRAASQATTFPPGVGLPGRVWKLKQPSWVNDVTVDKNFPRTASAQEAGLRSGLGIPMLSGREVIAVVEFFLREPRKEDGRFIKVINAVAAQLNLVIERKRIEEAINFQAHLLNTIEQAVIATDMDGGVIYWNQFAERLYGWSMAEALGQEVKELLRHTDSEEPAKEMWAILRHGQGWAGELTANHRDGKLLQVWLNISPIFDARGNITGMLGISHDITERKRAESFRDGQSRVLEMVAAGFPLADVLTSLVLLIESQTEGMLCSVLLLDEDGEKVHHGAAPSLPEFYIKAIDGILIGPRAGSCGAAMYKGEPVVVTDILSDPLWEDYRELAVAAGLRACWSTPILSHQGRVLGSFAMYYREPRSPRPSEQRLTDIAIHIAGIAIERQQAEEALKESEDQVRLFVEHTPVAVAMFDREMRYIMTSRRWLKDNNLGEQNIIGRSHYEVVPEIPERWKEGHQRCLSGAVERSEEDVFRHSDGSTDWVRWETRPWYNASGEIGGLIMFSEMITERKRAEDELLRLTVRLFSLQDEERRRIARELHDGTAQNLFAISINLTKLQQHSYAWSAEQKRILEECQTLSEQTLQEIRTLSYLLHPPLLDQAGLVSALQWYVEGFIKRSGIYVDLLVLQDIGRLPSEIETALFRIVQESLTNIHRHSGSNTASIRLEEKANEIILQIKDQGKGISAKELVESTDEIGELGVGIPGMQQRLRQLGGRLEVGSGEQGTTITASVPYTSRNGSLV